MAVLTTILVLIVSLVALFGGIHIWWGALRYRSRANKPSNSNRMTGTGQYFCITPLLPLCPECQQHISW